MLTWRTSTRNGDGLTDMYRKVVRIWKILDVLLPALQATRNLSDLVELEYREDRELVYAKFASGNQKIANVAMDSGTALIRDVIGQIV